MTPPELAAWGFFAGVLLTLLVIRDVRNTSRSAAFLDAADFLRAAAAKAHWGGAVIAPRVLQTYAASLEAWAASPKGGRENMPPVPDLPRDGYYRSNRGG